MSERNTAASRKLTKGYAALMHDLLLTAQVPVAKAQTYLDTKKWLESIVAGELLCVPPTDVIHVVHPPLDEGEA